MWQWLGATGDELPRVISFGAGPNCFSFGSNGLHDYPADRFFEAGATLPPEYSADPELLAEDFDVVLYCAGWSQQSTFEAQDADAVQAFVTQHGGGLYLASEYWGPALCPMDNPYPCGATGGIYQEQLDMINSISVALGTTFGMGFVNWAATEGTAEVGIECFPTPAG